MEITPTPVAAEPRYWYRVTPLSRSLALMLFIVLPFLGFFLGVNYKESLPPVYVISVATTSDIIAPTVKAEKTDAGEQLFLDKTPTAYSIINNQIVYNRRDKSEVLEEADVETFKVIDTEDIGGPMFTDIAVDKVYLYLGSVALSGMAHPLDFGRVSRFKGGNGEIISDGVSLYWLVDDPESRFGGYLLKQIPNSDPTTFHSIRNNADASVYAFDAHQFYCRQYPDRRIDVETAEIIETKNFDQIILSNGKQYREIPYDEDQQTTLQFVDQVYAGTKEGCKILGSDEMIPLTEFATRRPLKDAAE